MLGSGGRLLIQDRPPTLPFVSDLGTWLGILSGNSACLGGLLCCGEWVAICAGEASGYAKSVGVPGYKQFCAKQTGAERMGFTSSSCIHHFLFKGPEVLWYGLGQPLCVSLSFTQFLKEMKVRVSVVFLLPLSISHLSSLLFSRALKGVVMARDSDIQPLF